MRKHIFAGLLSAFSILLLLSGCAPKAAEDATLVEVKEGELLSGKITAEIDMGEFGKIKLELDADSAPITVTNFVSLANSKFYDGLTFHRIIQGFMIQGGDPEGTGYGGSDKTIKGEFSLNGVDNQISHTRGTISMARSDDGNSATTDDLNSASSQFFICDADDTALDGQYAAFGHVTDGMDVVDEIAKTPVVDQNGTVVKENQPVIVSIRAYK
jgi:peptidyl-prolyl cis-trans isomerase B (cyclophilin B)